VKTLQKTLAILACLFLQVQTVRHVYVLWFEPRGSVLDRFNQPLRDEIAAATSLEELLRRYEPSRKEVDRVKAERRSIDPKASFENDQDSEPFKSERSLREAISSWEERQKEIHALRFYWLMGLLLGVAGLACCIRGNQWVGMTLLIVAFSEFIYWTCPTFLGTATREFDRLLLNKLAFSLASLLLLALVINRLGVFKQGKNEAN